VGRASLRSRHAPSYDCLRFGIPDGSALVGTKTVEGGIASLINRGFEGLSHDISSLFAQTERLASALKCSTATANRVAFASLADRNDVDPALPAVEKAPRRRHATIGLPGRDGSGRANIASP
jgi:hypothetical protein